jgi:hypothetical protein
MRRQQNAVQALHCPFAVEAQHGLLEVVQLLMQLGLTVLPFCC